MNRDAPRFTVILAGCQTAPYLPKALASVAGQTFGDFEAICYVEESTDGSAGICRAAAARDARFRVAEGPRSGAVATTRNYGIDHADGEYLVILDGDDWLAPDALARIDAKLRATGPADVVSFALVQTDCDQVDWNDRAARFSNFGPEDDAAGLFSGFDAIRRAGKGGSRMHNYAVLCAYRVEFLRENGLRQRDGMVMEDFEWTPRVWAAATRFAYADAALYEYRRRPGSLTTESSPRAALHLAAHFRSLVAFALSGDVPADILRIWSNQWLAVLFWFLWHPVTSGKLSNGDRREALRSILRNGGARNFFRTIALATAPKKTALPAVLLAAAGWQFPAKMFFRRVYYPLVLGRQRASRNVATAEAKTEENAKAAAQSANVAPANVACVRQ